MALYCWWDAGYRTLQNSAVFTKPFRSDQGASATTVLLSSSQRQFHFWQAWVTCGFLKSSQSPHISVPVYMFFLLPETPFPFPHICQARTFLPFCHTSIISQFSIPCYLSFFPLYYSLKDKDNVLKALMFNSYELKWSIYNFSSFNL